MWIQSMVRDDGQRTQLHELDQAIQSLRTRLGDGPELVTLTGHYHNLLRRWAEI
jgi:PKHD-type hydroxylase